MIGIILAGGSGSRLRPTTFAFSKQLQPIFNKPMIYYPISTLMLAGIREIVLITTANDKDAFFRLLGDGSHLGVQLHYVVQPSPAGIAEAFPLSQKFIEGRKVALILGDNLFHGQHMGTELRRLTEVVGAHIFGYQVSNPQDYGVVEIDSNNQIISIEEKPINTKSKLAVPGLYFYDETVLELAKSVKPSPRGEIEITDLNRLYLDQGNLKVSILPRGTAWLDTGTFESLHDASAYIKAIEERQGLMVSCIEEIAFRNGWIDESELGERINFLGAGPYATYLMDLLQGMK